MRTRVEEGSASVTTALTALEEVVEEVDETSATVAEINDATGAQADTTQAVHAMTDDAAAISEKTAAEAENVSAAAQEQAASLTEVSTGTQELSRTARQLRDRLTAFVVNDTDHGSDRGSDESTPTHRRRCRSVRSRPTAATATSSPTSIGSITAKVFKRTISETKPSSAAYA